MSNTKSQSQTGHPSAAFVSLDSIVRKALIDFDGDSMHGYFKFLNYAYYGVQDLNMDIKGNIKDEVVTMRDNRTIQVPADMITWLKIGYVKDDLIYFIHNKDCAVLKQPDTETDPPVNVQNIKLDTCCTNGDANYFRYQDKEATIYFPPDADLQDVYLRYLATPYQLAGETMIPTQAEQMILWRIKMEYAAHIPQMARLYELYESRYMKARTMARARLDKTTVNDIYKISVKYFGHILVRVR